jgi:hypothetical protein
LPQPRQDTMQRLVVHNSPRSFLRVCCFELGGQTRRIAVYPSRDSIIWPGRQYTNEQRFAASDAAQDFAVGFPDKHPAALLVSVESCEEAAAPAPSSAGERAAKTEACYCRRNWMVTVKCIGTALPSSVAA